MRKILIVIFVLFAFTLTLKGVTVEIDHPFTDSIYQTSAASDTSRWLEVPVGYDSVYLFIQGTGNDAGDKLKGILDFAELDTADAYQLWSVEASKEVTLGDATVNDMGTYAYPFAFKYYRLIRAVTVVTTSVTGRIWIVWVRY